MPSGARSRPTPPRRSTGRGGGEGGSSRSGRRRSGSSKVGGGARTARSGRSRARPSIFITPGYRFRAVDLLMTNFHLPRSTLFMLVSAFSGRETMLAAYAHAIDAGYRFYSYGDASPALSGGTAHDARRLLHRPRDRRHGADRRARAAARHDPHAGLHAGRHGGDGEGDVSRPGAGARRRHHPRQHLPPDAPAGRGAGGGARRPPRLRQLAVADPHRFRRVPGDVAVVAPEDRRGRRHLPLAYRRLRAPADAGALARDPGAARFRHPDAARRMRGAARRPRGDRQGDAALAPLGGAVEGGLRRDRGEGAVRHRPGRRHPGSPARSRRRGWSRSASTATRSAAWRWASRRRRCSR